MQKQGVYMNLLPVGFQNDCKFWLSPDGRIEFVESHDDYSQNSFKVDSTKLVKKGWVRGIFCVNNFIMLNIPKKLKYPQKIFLGMFVDMNKIIVEIRGEYKDFTKEKFEELLESN